MAPAKPPSSDSFNSSQLYVLVKALEGKVNNLVREVNVLKHDLTTKNKKIADELKNMNEDLLDLRRDQEMMTRKMDLVVKELKQTAGIDDVTTIKKYIDLWNPLHFVTQRDVERIVELKTKR